MSKIDYQHLMQYQRQVEEGEVIYQPDPDDDNGYFLEHGVAYLIDDEAYYNLWSSNLSLGYYDHPPMIAWWISLGKSVFGETTLGVRFCASIAFFLVSILVARIAFIIGGGDRILISVILFNKWDFCCTSPSLDKSKFYYTNDRR